jgi:hypothetical protein
MATYELKVPGWFEGTMLDLETVKVPTAEGFRLPSGEPLRRRWSIALAGVARDGRVWIVAGEGDEATALEELGDALASSETVTYAATREFDEMICRGRFTNARRAHLPAPTFPVVPGAEEIGWRNLGASSRVSREANDLPSRDVPAALARGDVDAVMVHLLRDVAELILLAGRPDATASEWCSRVLREPGFALAELYGDE